MKNHLLVILGLSIMVSACEGEVSIDLLSQPDETALLAMEQEMAMAILYNDSLATYINTTGINNDDHCWYYDGHYHQHDSLYQLHHTNYSHSYGWDDHTMGSGGMMHGQHQHQQGNFPAGMGHYQRNHESMDSLHTVHQGYHPPGQ
jgi:hypothetical protein